MQLNEAVDNLTAWIQKNLCDDMEFLNPPAKSGDMEREYNLVTPKAFALYVPPKDQLPPEVSSQIPSICLQLVKGSDDMVSSERSLEFRLSFSTYRPGSFAEDEQGELKFTRNADGWEELWLWISKSISKLQTEMYIEGLKVEKSTPIKYGHFQIDDNLVDAYPMWYAWIELTITCGISPKANNYNDYL